MADDYQVKDANGNTITMSSEDVGGGKQAPRHSIPDGKDSTQGAIADAIVAAGATGSISAKLRRVTQALEDLKTSIAIAAGENHIGEVGGKTIITNIVFSMPAATTHLGDVLADSQVLSSCLRINNGTGILISAQFNDEDNVGGDLDAYVLDSNVSLGSENSVPNISDADARNILGVFSIKSTDWKDLGNLKVAFPDFKSIPVKGVSGTDDLYLALIDKTGGARSANGITARISILCD